MSYHFIHIDNPCHIHVDTKRLMVKKHEGETIPLTVNDCAVIILNHYQITITQNALALCAKAGAVLITTDAKHLPIAINLPMQINFHGAKNPWLQIHHLNSKLAKQWWCHIVTRKINGQAQLLLCFDNKHSNRLLYLAKTTDSDNAHQHEAIAAAIYWKEFFKILNAKTKREKQDAEHPINQHLNYGYAVIRSLLARSLAGAGLCLNFGLGHIRKDNPFNLVEDIMEPYRPLIDKIIMQIYQENYFDTITTNSKAELVRRTLEMSVILGDKNYRLMSAMDETVNSYCRALTKTKTPLLFPDYQSLK